MDSYLYKLECEYNGEHFTLYITCDRNKEIINNIEFEYVCLSDKNKSILIPYGGEIVEEILRGLQDYICIEVHDDKFITPVGIYKVALIYEEIVPPFNWWQDDK